MLPSRGIAAVHAAAAGRPRRGRRAPWRVAPEAIGKPSPSTERFMGARSSRRRSRAATSNGASVRKPSRRTPSARASRVTRMAPSRATFARHCRRSCRRRRPATPRPTSTVAARARSTSSPVEASWRARPLPLRAWGALPTWGSMISLLQIGHRVQPRRARRGAKQRFRESCFLVANEGPILMR